MRVLKPVLLCLCCSIYCTFSFCVGVLFTTFDCSCIQAWLIRIVTGSEHRTDVVVQHFSKTLWNISCKSVSMYSPLRSIVYILWSDKRTPTNERIVLSLNCATHWQQTGYKEKMMNNCLCALSLENLVYIKKKEKETNKYSSQKNFRSIRFWSVLCTNPLKEIYLTTYSSRIVVDAAFFHVRRT